MKENYKIKFLKKEDISTVISLVKLSFQASYLIPSIYRGVGIEKFIANELDNPFSSYKYFVVYNRKEIVGYAEFKIFKEKAMVFLNIIVISNKYKGTGIGSRLLEYSKSYFLSNGYSFMQLDVFKSNFLAINYYNKFGFKNIGIKNFYSINTTNFFSNDVVKIANYPNYLTLIQIYGFSFLEFFINGISIRVGVIEDDIIIREESCLQFRKNINKVSKVLGINNIYQITEQNNLFDAVLQDEIYRLQLEL